ncbi:DNA polymerase-3 subunit gamma/tau [Sphingomonas naasensis]|uniref:DNA polymerase III subunit gamma/tau n=1 Tax=Sphingomonas naasensis TaxID=1344951 RepID=A0A4S1WPT4_9SPHN|nr:DNA polymerase III subunit gamma/tau [Sphingomonas naasensis]NIJ20467.1 DNA polymerase-3 subunit gamma/tau [Sphingomonas naasensis]TGX44565.1 DNA polymerase III subunit gamma/tau [Sphingomonas naasensis]
MSDSLLGLDEPPQPRDNAYRVLARKYRPQTFSELIGQDAMVQTLGNAIKRDRLAHAFLLTGVRGVGKTSTARLIAKALNCIGPDGQGGPTIDPCGVCEPCRAIAEGRHIDVIEMDAASHTGVDDVREIIEASRYSAVSARYKIYIIDEVHMLSKSAFNALLKTLEEPPAHVKFLFATTEVNKVPVTVLSRCQRFDLRRIPAEKLAAHFAMVAQAEGVEAEPEALTLIARAAEGSARDGLSILDQAIAHAGLEGGGVHAEAVRQMLGLSDRGAIRTLFGLLLAGDASGALAALRGQYDLGVDPQAVLRTLLETVHGVTLAKLGTEANAGQSTEELKALQDWAAGLSFPALHRLWQLLLRGHDEVARAVLPIEACEMALLRVIHASQLPDPGELARQIANGSVSVSLPASAPAAVATSAEPAMPGNMAELVAHLERNKRFQLAQQVRDYLRPVRFEGSEFDFGAARDLPQDFIRDLGAALRESTGVNWRLTCVEDAAAPTLREEAAANEAAERDAVLASPVVAAAIEAFPDAELIGWTKTRSNQA